MTVYTADEFSASKHSDSEIILALGNFDGVHIGHSALIEYAASKKKEHPHALLAIRTFISHPNPECMIITPKAEKEALLTGYGTDILIYDSFRDIREYPPEKFVSQILCGMNLVCCVCGYNYHFGKNAEGDSAALQRLLEELGIPIRIIPEVSYEGGAVSSTRIRGELLQGNIERANALLGHPFRITLPVTHGRRIGRELGFPTINQNPPKNLVKLPHGVYASACRVNGKLYPAVTNVGTRPTIDENDCETVCETHLINYSGTLYGELCTIGFLKYLRPERKFGSVELLRAAISSDSDESQKVFSSAPDKLLKLI